jgi:hypothetical protein
MALAGAAMAKVKATAKSNAANRFILIFLC